MERSKRKFCVTLRACAVVLALAAGCSSSRAPQGAAQRPSPGPVGVPAGPVTTQVLSAAGGSVSSANGRVRVDVPANALRTATTVAVQEVTNTAPNGVGSAYRLRPEGTTFSVPVTLTFRPDAFGGSLEDLAIAYQDDSGYWSRVPAVVRDAAAGTLTVTSRHFSDWSVVTGPTARDLTGTFTISSNVDFPVSFVVDGQATLTFAGESTTESFYLLGGTQAPRASLAVGGATCSATTPTLETTTNIAELMKSPAELAWGTSGHWNLTCTDGTTLGLDYAFDTIGLAKPGCARGWLGTPTVGPDLVLGTYYIDCGTRGRMDATWRFVGSSCGGPCQPADPCRSGTLDCSTGAAVCVADGNAVNGSACGAASTCHMGACVQSRTVQGTRLVTYWPDVGAPLAPAPAPDTFSAPFADVAALVSDGSGGFVTYPGAIDPTGAVSIQGVPAGAYVLAFVAGDGRRTFLEAAADTVDLGYDVLGRSDAVLAQASTPVTLDVTGATPWTPGDELQLTSSNGDLFDVPTRSASIAPGSTALALVDDWAASATGGPMHLLVPADVLWVHDAVTLGTTQPGGTTSYPYLAAANAAAVSGVALVSGAPASVAVPLAPTAATGYVCGDAATGLDWRLTQFEAQLGGLAGLGAMPPGSVHTLSVGAAGRALANPAPISAGTPTMFRLQLDAGTGDFSTAAGLSYGQFLDPALWVEWRGVQLVVPVQYLLAPATTPLTDAASVGYREPMSPQAVGPIVPRVLPVQSPAIQGLGAFGGLTGTGTTPTVSWAAPPAPSAAPTSYLVEILALGVSGSQTVASPVASWRVTSTTLTVPANLLEVGRTYYARITATASSPDPLVTKPLSGQLASAWATTLTGTFSP